MPDKKLSYGVTKRKERFRARPYVPGRGHVYAGTWDTPEEATKAAIAKIEAERKLPPQKETIGTFCARWITDFPRPKESTNDSYRDAARRFAADFGDRKLHDFSVSEAMEYARKRPYDAPKLSAMYGDARREDLVLPDHNPFSRLGISKGRGRKDIVAITEEELQQLAALALSAHGDTFGPVFRSIILFGAYTTLRPGEMFGLDRPDLQGEEIAIDRQFYKRRVQLPKRGPRRLPFIPPQALQALSEMPRQIPAPICPITKNEIVFAGKEGQRISQSSLSNYWKPVRVAFEAGLTPERRAEFQRVRNPKDPTMDFYELRHFGATVMAERGVEPWVAAAMMGHDDGGTLFKERYSHPRNAIARERLKQAFSEPTKLHGIEGGAEEATG